VQNWRPHRAELVGNRVGFAVLEADIGGQSTIQGILPRKPAMSASDDTPHLPPTFNRLARLAYCRPR
jgi:hypothetical protein